MTKRKATPETEYETYQIPGTDVSMRGRKERHPLAPPVRPFLFDAGIMADLAMAVDTGMHTLLTGPSGCGKTQTVEQTAAVLGMPFIRYNLNGETRVSQLVGQQRPAMIDGVLGLEYHYSRLAMAMREGWWVFLDELDMGLGSVLSALHPVLEDHPTLFIPDTGETIRAHEDFRVFASGNTIGYRARTRARFAGTGPLNTALLGRFGMVLACDYPSEEIEAERLRCHVPDIEPAYLLSVCRVASKLREDEDFASDFSTRSLIQWLKVLEKGGESFEAFEKTILLKLENPADREVAIKALDVIFDYKQKGRGQ